MVMISSVDLLAQGVINKKTKVYSNFNPYYIKENQLEIIEIEQIIIYHKKIKQTRMLGEFLKDEKVKKRVRKKVIKDLLKYWRIDFYNKMQNEKEELLSKTKKVKKIRRVPYIFVFLCGIIFILSLFINSKVTYLTRVFFIGKYISQLFVILDEPHYNLFFIGLTYLSLITILFIAIIKTYFIIFRNTGYIVEGYINTEFKKIEKNYQEQEIKVKKHLIKSLRKSYKKSFNIIKTFTTTAIINKLNDYSKTMENKVEQFYKKYYKLLFVQFLLIIGVLGLTGYIGYIFYINYK